jgi:hypothetical protein
MSKARNLGDFGGTITASGDLSFDDNTGILDSNSNEIILFQEAASAVNYLNIGNHSTGNAPYITSGGTDTDVDLAINTKGAGLIACNAPMWFSAGFDANGIMFDDQKQKRISWNDGNGNFTIRSGVYYDSGEKYVVAGDGATKITLTSDAAQGALTIGVATIGTNADDPVTYAHSFFMDASGTFTYDGTRIHNEGDEGSWINVSFLNSWANYSVSPGYNSTQYRKAADGRIDIRGLIKDGTAGHVFTLPVGYRPSGVMLTSTYGGNGQTRLDISTSGTVIFSAGYSNSFQSLELSFYP